MVPLKKWREYTKVEKDSLQNRWTDEEVNDVVKALLKKRELPEFVHRLPSLDGKRDSCEDLRGISFRVEFLDDTDMSYMHLQGALLTGAVLRHTDLTNANLQGAEIAVAHFERAFLRFANLKDAYAWRANFKGADLGEAKLQRANLVNAYFQDADLYAACFDSTYLYQVDLGKAKNIRYIVWGDSINPRYVIGEEIKMESEQEFRKAENTYRDLKSWYQKELLEDVAAEFHIRENEVKTKRYLKTAHSATDYLRWFFRIVLFQYPYAYESRPILLLWYSARIILLFAAIFASFIIFANLRLSNSGIVKARSYGREQFIPFRYGFLFLECLYFSLLSFATFGYGALRPRQWLQFFLLEPVEYKPVRWARIFVGIEAALGIWIFALLVTVLFGK